jgi:thiosulfate/3-mercaptopyruvate sulfurtransferase
MTRKTVYLWLGVLSAGLCSAPVAAQELGTISFPTSAAPAAQGAFVQGVKYLHSARMHLPEGREDFHTLSWLTYANLMLGRFDDARRNVAAAKAAADRNPGNPGIRNGYLGMRARYILETGRWQRIPLEAPAAASEGAHAGMPGMAAQSSGPSATWTFITGYSAAKLGDYATADSAEARLRAMRERLEASGNAYGAKPIAIMEKELGAVSRFARGQRDAALALAKQAMDIELTLGAPSGPPEPIKPASELYGELLLEAGRPEEARSALEVSLQRTPNRTPSVRAMQRARQASVSQTAAEPRVRRELLVSSEWLSGRTQDPGVVVLHVGSDRGEYERGHIPGARFLPLSAIVTERDGVPNELPSVAQLDSVFESVGVSDDSRVVVYGAPLAAARTFFTLDYLGHGDRTALLNGGLGEWKAAGRPLSTDPPRATRGDFTPHPAPERVVNAEWVRDHLADPAVALVDARSEAQFSGAEPGHPGLRAGQIPGAGNVYWQELLDSVREPALEDSGLLERKFRAAGAGPGDTVVTYCNSGMQASVAYFVARYLGYDTKMYDGSLTDWSRRPELPLER